MKSWEGLKDEIRKVSKDKEMARSISKMADTRRDALKLLEDKAEFASISVEYYYEIIKELMTGIMAIEGYKTLSHEALIAYLSHNHKEFSQAEITLIDELRKLRNKIVYQGFFIEPAFVDRNKNKVNDIIERLLRLIKSELSL